MHRALVERFEPDIAGRWRREQVWIGGGRISSHNAAFVPPRADRVPGAIDDLVAFAHRDDIPALSHAAIAHAQFETIHPFPDGNGRTGRALIHAMIRNRALPLSRCTGDDDLVAPASKPVNVKTVFIAFVNIDIEESLASLTKKSNARTGLAMKDVMTSATPRAAP
jgi:fido (protein-threonine AMPylation protein)